MLLDTLTLMHANHRPRCIASVDKVFTYHSIQLMTRGKVDLFYDQQRYEMKGNWFWPCFPGPHIRFCEYHAGQSWDHRYIAFTGPKVSRWEADGIIPHQPMALTEELTQKIVPQFDEMLLQMNRPSPWGQARAINLLESILLLLAEQNVTPQPAAPQWLASVLQRLGQLDHEVIYQEMAEEHHLSLTSLRRHFREATGTTLHKYRLDLRITEARHRLGNTDQPIKQIADELGYQDIYYFTRQFTQAVGISPARFRRSRQI